MALYNNAAIRIPAKPRRFGSRQITYRARPSSLPLSFSPVSYFRARWQLKPTPRSMKSEIAARISRRSRSETSRQINSVPTERRSTPRGHSLSLGRAITVLRRLYLESIGAWQKLPSPLFISQSSAIVKTTLSCAQVHPVSLRPSSSPSRYRRLLTYCVTSRDSGLISALPTRVPRMHAREIVTLDIARVETILASFLSNSSTRAQERRNENGDCSKRE